MIHVAFEQSVTIPKTENRKNRVETYRWTKVVKEALSSLVGVPGIRQGNETGPDPWRGSDCDLWSVVSGKDSVLKDYSRRRVIVVL
jgi:hypothetical protein